MFFMSKHGPVSTLCGYYFKYKNGGGGRGHCVLKWILRKHLTPTPNETIYQHLVVLMYDRRI